MKIFIILLVCILIFINFYTCSDKMEKHYSSYEDIVNDGGFKRGWVPKFLPESSYDIFLKSDIDINKVWLTFRFRFEHLNNIQVKLDLPDSIETTSINPDYALEITNGGSISIAFENNPSSQARLLPDTDSFKILFPE